MDANSIMSPKVSEAAAVTVDRSKDGETQVPYIISVLTVACVLSTAVVLMRLYTRLRILRTFGADDMVMGLAQVLTLGSAAAIYCETAYGLGRHVWLLTDYTAYMKSFYSSIVVYNVATCILKISILLQVRRIFQNPLMQKITFVGLMFETAWAVTLSVLLPLVCVPVSAFWDTSVPGRCLDQLAIWYVMASVNLVTDFVVFSLPLPVVRSLQLPRRQKIMLMGVFCLGFFTCIISVYRITTLSAAADSTDSTWDNVGAAVWSLLELSIGVLAACLPTLKPLFALALPRLFRSTLANLSSAGRRGHQQYRDMYGVSARQAGVSVVGGTTTASSATVVAGKGAAMAGGGIVFVKVDPNKKAGDMAALRGSDDGSLGSGGDGDIEMPTYHVSVTGGSPRKEFGPVGGVVGIHTTTTVTQRVDSL